MFLSLFRELKWPSRSGTGIKVLYTEILIARIPWECKGPLAAYHCVI